MRSGRTNAILQARELGQAMWLDYIQRDMLHSGEFKRLVDLGISGVTANPTILEKAITGSTDYDTALAALAKSGKSPEEIYESLAIEDIRGTADMLLPVYQATGGADGYASLEISPLIAADTQRSIEDGRRLFRALARPNVMVKVPATPEGIPAIRQLTAEGINVNVTLIFALDYYTQSRDAYISGLQDFVRQGGDPAKVASVASFFLSRIDTVVDGLLAERAKTGETQLKALQGKAAIASAKVAYGQFRRAFSGPAFAELRKRHAHVQRVLWASTGTKNPDYSDVMYVEPLIGADTVNTMPLATIHCFLHHGKVAPNLERGTEEAAQTLKDIEAAGISLKAVTDKLLADGVRLFSESYERLLKGIQEKCTRLKGGR